MLLKSLAQPSPVTSLLPTDDHLFALMEEMLEGKSVSICPSKFKQLQEHCPFISKHVEDVENIPENIHPIMRE